MPVRTGHTVAMTDSSRDPRTDATEHLEVPGERIRDPKLSALRPHVERLRAVRTGEWEAALYVGWPESSLEGVPIAPMIYEQARVLARATDREEHLLEVVPWTVDVRVAPQEPEVSGQEGMVVLMDLSDRRSGGPESARRWPWRSSSA